MAAFAVALPVHHNPKRHGVSHRRGCKTTRCDRHADRHYRRRLERRRHRREAREAAEGWPLPGYVMECESHYHNEPPHNYGPGIDPSGYEQIISSTWRAHGGGEFASEAWLATRAQQAIVTRRILASGGLREWACA